MTLPAARLALAIGLAALIAPAAALAVPAEVPTAAGPVKVEAVAEPLEHPWGMAFLPDGRLLVTERPGRLRVVVPGGGVSAPVAGVPAVHASGQGGLLDVALSPKFADDRLVYLSYAEAGEGGAGTAVVRGRLNEAGSEIEGTEVIFRQAPKVASGKHFGSRLVFAADGRLFVTLGDRGEEEPAQDLTNTIGAIVRIEADGKVPPTTPSPAARGWPPRSIPTATATARARRCIRNRRLVAARARAARRRRDQRDRARPKLRWPLVSWGRHYSGWPIDKPDSRPELTDAIYQWTPVIAASGMAFYTAELFPGWKGSLLVGGLVSKGIVRLTLEGTRVTGEERLALGERVRDVRQGPDGAIYVLTDEDDGKLLRLTPATPAPRG